MSERLLTAIRESTLEEKRAAMAELARDLLLAHESGTAKLRQEEYQGMLTMLPPPPPEIAAQIPTDDPEWVAELQRRMKTAGKGLTATEVIAELKRRASSANAPR